MAKKLSKLQLAQQKAESASKKTNQKINELGQHTGDLYASLTAIQALFDRIRNVPEENRLKYENLKAIRVNWKQQAEKIELEYKKAEVKAAGQGAAGVGAGVAVVTLGPTVAMGVATTFGVASTGTAISALSGAAATNAALAWLGGGALAAGGGGMAAGSAFLALAGPIGWTIAGLSIIASGLMFFKTKGDKERLENVYTLISNRDVKSYELAIVELSERIKRIIDETGKLEENRNLWYGLQPNDRRTAVRIGCICKSHGSRYKATRQSYFGSSAKVLRAGFRQSVCGRNRDIQKIFQGSQKYSYFYGEPAVYDSPRSER